MRGRAIVALVLDNVSRHLWFAMASVVGVAFAVAVLVFFVGLGYGIQTRVVEQIFDRLPETRLKLMPGGVDLGLLNFAKPKFLKGAQLTEDMLKEMKETDGVSDVYAEMNIAFPIRISGSLFGQYVGTDLVATGISPEAVAAELDSKDVFKYSEEGPVPVIVSRRIFDLYNTTFAPMNDYPSITEKTIKGFRFDLTLGKSYLGGRAERGKPRKLQCQLVGFSNKAVAIGITVPLEYVRKWNAEYKDDATNYSALYIDTRSPATVATIRENLVSRGYKVETAEEGTPESISEAIRATTLILVGVSLAIMVLAAVNLAFLMLMMVQRRTAEIGLWRTIGATRLEMGVVILGEALLLGLGGGILGASIGQAAGAAVENFVLPKLGALTILGDTLFVFPPWLWLLALMYGAGFAVLGAFWPAWRAARLDPVEALRYR